MKTQIVRLCLGVFFAFISFYSSAESNGPFFWEVSKEGEKEEKPFYVLGSLHMGLGLEDLQCSDQISSHLAETPVLLVEHQIPHVWDLLRILIQLEGEGASSPSAIGFNDLTAQSRQFFKEKFPSELLNRLGLDVGQIETTTLLTLKVILGFICLSDHPSIMESLIPLMNKYLDIEIMKQAKGKNKPIVNMDNVDSEELKKQMLTHIKQKLLSGSVEQLEGVVSNYDKMCTIDYLQKKFKDLLLSAQIVEPYINGKSLGVVDSLKASGYSGEELEKEKHHFEQNLLKARNELWFPKIKKAYQKHGPVFVVAGVSHFVDAHNVLDMLKADGFSVKRYNRNCVAEQ